MLVALVILLSFIGILAVIVAAVLWYTPSPKEAVTNQGGYERSTLPQERTPDATPLHVKQQGPALVERISFRQFVGIVDRAFQVGIIGETGSGKTSLAQALMRAISGLLYVLDPNFEQGKWPGLDVVTTDDDDGYAPMDAGIQNVFSEMRDRVVRKRKHGPDAVGPRLNVFWDEINDHMEESSISGDILRRMVKRSRNYNIKLFIFPHSKRVKDLNMEGRGDTATNLMWVYLGDQARAFLAAQVRSKKINEGEYRDMVVRERLCVVEWAGKVFDVDTSTVLQEASGPSLADRQWVPETTRETPQEVGTFKIDHVMAAYLLGRNEERRKNDPGVPALGGRTIDKAINGKSGGRSSKDYGTALDAVRAVVGVMHNEGDADGTQG